MEHIPLSESDEEKNRLEYAAFCRYCGLLLSDGVMIWRDSLKTAGLPIVPSPSSLPWQKP